MCHVVLMKIYPKVVLSYSNGTLLPHLPCRHVPSVSSLFSDHWDAEVGFVKLKGKKLLPLLYRHRDESLCQRVGVVGGGNENT